jgi:TolB-like protein
MGVAYVVAAWVVLQVLDVVGEILELPAWGGKLLLALIVAGFFVTVFVAWVFELTPEGVKRESEVDRSKSVTAETGRKLNIVILGLMALAVTYLLFDKFYLTPNLVANRAETSQVEPAETDDPAAAETAAPETRQPSIAVLPFDNRSSREEDRFFTDGIHDDLLTTIARIGSMKVISRTSVMEYRDTTKKIPEIARELGVSNVLEGGIQRAGNQIRINVQLIDAATDEHLWAETYDRVLTAENLFAIQSEISNRIAEALQATLSPDERQRISQIPTASLDAYDAFLQGKQLMAARTVKDLKLATEKFRQSVELDPQFALAWVGLADAHYLLALYTRASEADTIAIREDAVEKALALNPTLGEAYVSQALIHEFYKRYEEMEEAFRKAIELSPNYATAYHWYSSGITDDPLRSRERLELLLKAVEIDPRSMIIGASLASEYFFQGLFSRGEQQALKIIELFPNSANGHHELVDHYEWNVGEFAKSMEHARAMDRIDPGSIDALRHQIELYVQVGEYQAATAVQQRIAELHPKHYFAGWSDFLIAASEGNARALREHTQWMLTRAANADWLLPIIGSAMVTIGEVDRARDLYLQADPGWLNREEWADLIKFNPGHVCLVSWILTRTGDAELGQGLLEEATVFLERTLPAAIEHADRFVPDICYLMAGDTEKALASLETQLSHGHIASWRYDHRLPLYELIRHEPRYQAMVEERDRRIAEQRQLIGAPEL